MNEREERAQVRRILYRWGNVASFCASKQRDIRDFNLLIESAADIQPAPLSGMPHGNGTTDSTATKAALIDAYNDRISDLQDDIRKELDFAAAVDSLMLDLDVNERDVIEQKFKRGKSIIAISQTLSYCDAQIENIERSAVDKLRGMINIRVF